MSLDGPSRSVEAARRTLERIGASGGALSREEVLQLIAEESGRLPEGPAAVGPVGGAWWEGQMAVYAAGRLIRPRTPNQETYIEAIRTHDLVIGSGPAGTGKTYLAVAAAVHLMRTGRVRKLVLVRPAIEAGEKLGFLPGDLQAKVNPYLRPLLDALHDMLDYATIQRFIANDVVEIAPLAYMRGRTLNASVVILDEGQNTTAGQMQMFLTRMGHGSKMIVTGDPTQIDLPDPAASGLIDAARRLARVRGVAIVALDRADVVRHDLVQRIVEAYGVREQAAE
ncbi:MAG: PhoH family protein [Phycisphaerales bacterium JB039]